MVQNPNKKNLDRPYENVAAVSTMRLKDVEACPPLVNAPFAFDLEEPDLEVYARIPAWIRKKVESNLEFPGSLLATLLEMGENAPPSIAVDVTVDGPGPAPDPEEETAAALDDENPY